jgi:hypothetical protein
MDAEGTSVRLPDLPDKMTTLWIWSVSVEYYNMFVFNVLFWHTARM